MTTRLLITVGQGEGDITGTTNAAIQAAVDRAGAMGGGVVQLLPGTYEMHDSLHMRDHVAVSGNGDDTVLWKVPSVQSTIPAFLGYGHYDFIVSEPDKYHVGMGVLLHDDDSRGFYDTVATIIRQNGDEFGIDRMLNHDYHIASHASVTSVYPIVSACGVHDARVENLAIDGNRNQNEYLNGCRGGGIYLLQAQDVTIKRVTVQSFNGDGISFQQCIRTTIEDCHIIGNNGHGLHPGSGSVTPVMRRCQCENNAEDGIFYCLRVTYSLCEDCEIAQNGHDGISIGERDSHHIIQNNRISGNGRYGIYFRKAVPTFGGNDNIITRNVLHDNCQAAGESEIYVEGGISRLYIVQNQFTPAQATTAGVTVMDNCSDIVVSQNAFPTEPLTNFQPYVGVTDCLHVTEVSFPAGPQDVPEDCTWHLNVT